MTTVDTTTGEIVDSLTAMERSALTHAEAKIERGLTSFIEVGEALAEVRDARLYREDFGTFEAYCRRRWGITDRRARQMIDATTIVASLPTGTTVPVTESQARELSGLDPEDAAEVMEIAEDISGGSITATKVREAREIAFPTARPAPVPTQPLTTHSPCIDCEEPFTDARFNLSDERCDSCASIAAAIATPAPVSPPGKVVGLDGKPFVPTPTPKPERSGEQQNAEENSRTFASSLIFLLAFQHPAQRDNARVEWEIGRQAVSPTNRDYVTPDRMRTAARGLLDLADEWENTYA